MGIMSWFWTIIFLTFTFHNHYYFSEARHLSKHPSVPVVVVGTVSCDTCFKQEFPKGSHFIAGASVAVECKDTNSRQSFRQEAKTDENGEFKVHLPFSVSKHVKKIKGCAVKLLSSNEPYCSVAAAATSSSMHLKSREQGTHIFSAGFFTFKPLKQPEICDQKPSINDNKADDQKLSPIANPNDPAFLPPIRDPPQPDPPLLGGGGNGGLLPRLPNILPPLLPQLPRLPQIPLLPPLINKENAAKAKPSQVSDNKAENHPESFPFLPFPPNPLLPSPSLLPPNPLLPPPSLLPPNPFQPPPSVIPPIFPTPPPSLFPPLFPTPSRPPGFNLPPIPGFFTPPPPPPALPGFPIPLPPFPFQPTPGFPGFPGPPPRVVSQPKTGLP